MLGVRIAYGTPFSLRVALVALLGAAYTMAAVVISAIASTLVSRNGHHGLPVWQSMAWGMLYDAACSLVIALASGKTLNIVWTLPYLGSLLYLAVFGFHPAGAHRRGSYGLYRRDGASDRAHRVGVVRRLPMAACHLAGRWFVAGRQCHRHVAADQPA